MTTLMCRPRLTGMVAIVLLVAMGCGHRPVGRPPLAAEIKTHLGTIGIVQQASPWLEWDAKPARGGRDGATQGTASALAGVVGALAAADDHQAASGLLVAPAYVAVMALLGAVLAPPASAVEGAEDALDVVLADPTHLTALRDPIARLGQAYTPHAFVLLPPRDPTSDRRTSPYSYATLARQGVDTLLEIGGPTIRLAPVDFAMPSNPMLRLSVLVRIRLVRTQDGEVVHTHSFVHHGDAHTFAGWGAADAKRFRSEVTRGFDTLGQEIVEHIFGPPVSPLHETREPERAPLDSRVAATERPLCSLADCGR
jgi:hypothetical protein